MSEVGFDAAGRSVRMLWRDGCFSSASRSERCRRRRRCCCCCGAPAVLLLAVPPERSCRKILQKAANPYISVTQQLGGEGDSLAID